MGGAPYNPIDVEAAGRSVTVARSTAHPGGPYHANNVVWLCMYVLIHSTDERKDLGRALMSTIMEARA